MDNSDIIGAASLFQDSMFNLANFSYAGKSKANAEDLMIKQNDYAQARQWDAQQWQKYMWELTNEYNLPANAVKRLQDAGLNPSLAYGSGDGAGNAVGASTSPTSGPGGTPSLQGFPLRSVSPGLLTAASDIRLRDADTKLAEERANTERSQQSLNDFTSILHSALAGKAGADADLSRINASIGEIQNLFLRDTFDDRKAITHEQLNEVRKSISFLDEQVYSLKASNSFAYEQARWMLSRLKADTAVAVAQGEYQRRYNKEMLPEQVTLLRNTIALSSQQFDLNWPSWRRAVNFKAGMEHHLGDAKTVLNRWWTNDVEASGFERFNKYVGSVAEITGIATDVIDAGLSIYTAGTSRGFLDLGRSRHQFDRSRYGRTEVTEWFNGNGEVTGGSYRYYP